MRSKKQEDFACQEEVSLKWVIIWIWIHDFRIEVQTLSHISLMIFWPKSISWLDANEESMAKQFSVGFSKSIILLSKPASSITNELFTQAGVPSTRGLLSSGAATEKFSTVFQCGSHHQHTTQNFSNDEGKLSHFTRKSPLMLPLHLSTKPPPPTCCKMDLKGIFGVRGGNFNPSNYVQNRSQVCCFVQKNTDRNQG